MQQISPLSYYVKLIAIKKIHLVFYVSLLKTYNHSKIPRRKILPPPLAEIDHEDEYEEKILYLQVKNIQFEYLIKYKGYNIYKKS